MIWCIIGIGLFILAFVFGKISKTLERKEHFRAEDIFVTLAIIFFIISIIVIAVCSTLIAIVNAYGKFEVEEAKDQRSVYIMLLEENKDITVQNQLYKDIVKYNSKIRKAKHYRNSLWTNWFYSDGWEDLEYIEINDYNIQGVEKSSSYENDI